MTDETKRAGGVGCWSVGVDYAEVRTDTAEGVELRAFGCDGPLGKAKTYADAARALRVAMLRWAADQVERGDAP